MATPYMVQKVALSSSNSGYHPELQGEIKCSGATHGNPNYYSCRFAYPNYCPVCETHKTPKCGRRRSKSEGLEADPLRERNRLCEKQYEVEHWRKRVVKEYDLSNYQDTSRFERQNNMQTGISGGELYHASLPQPMDVDGATERKTLGPIKKFKDNLLIGNVRHHHRNYDNGASVCHNLLFSEINENPKHFINHYNVHGGDNQERGHNVGISMSRKLTKVSDSIRKGSAFCDLMRTEGANNSDKHYANNIDNHSTPLHGLETKRDVHFCGSLGENCHCDKLIAQNGDSGPVTTKPVVVDSTSMQDRYLREVEVLRSKLRQLRGAAEGKRLRQRSESEPGAGFGNNGQGSAWEAKRARDDSPDLPENLDCYYANDGAHLSYTQRALQTSISKRDHLESVLHRSSNHRGRNTKLLHLPMPPSKTSIISKHSSETHDDETSVSSDSDFADSERTCASGEDGDSKGEPGEDSEEDDQSVLSSLTTISNDSNTPSVVGETLGSISLSDHAHKKVTSTNIVIDQNGLPQCLRASLFSYVPPYIRFSMHDVKGEALPSEIQRHMKWKLSTITPLVIRRTLLNSGFKLVRKSNDWCGTWGKHMKSLCFKTLKEFQKINHFPGTFQIGRKDRLWKNLYRLMTKFGKKEFGFIPRTYVLPQDNKFLRQAWEKNLGKEKWIIKPPASARGTGIKVVHRWAQIPKKDHWWSKSTFLNPTSSMEVNLIYAYTTCYQHQPSQDIHI
ncbi:hypothetical protein L9F63_004345 [Diploptera punctata]|uniref:Tubulin polyglutamylase TTLL4 n=1 Tax=Diploptera punctata TaxID=6984 RepID=A0AAD7ZH11_DIPPU|nr:hypothetical protein L9F63_004345 [Diploptera punctata]